MSLTASGSTTWKRLDRSSAGRDEEGHPADVGLARRSGRMTGVIATRIRARVIRAPSAGRGRGVVGQRHVASGREARVDAHEPARDPGPPRSGRASLPVIGWANGSPLRKIVYSWPCTWAPLPALTSRKISGPSTETTTASIGAKRLDEVDGHQREGRCRRGRRGRPRPDRATSRSSDSRDAQRATQALQNVTDGWWTPKTARSRSQISPSVRRRLDRVDQQRHQVRRDRGRRSPARRAPGRARSASRVRAQARQALGQRIADAGVELEEVSRAAGSSVTNSLTPTTIRALSSTSRCHR